MLADDLDVLVVGAGVSGLTTGVHLAESGLKVRIWTAELPGTTTSAAAGAMWGPYLAEPHDKVRAWSLKTLTELRRLSNDDTSGVRLIGGIEATRQPGMPPDWARHLDNFWQCDPVELPPGFATGWHYIAPIINMPKYLAHLERRFTQAGGSIEICEILNAADVAGRAPIVVNCTGTGANRFVPDPTVIPIRGQLVVVENPGITDFFSEDTGRSEQLLHIYPHGDTVVLGGTATPDVWSRQPDPDITTAIVARCAQVDYRLANTQIIDVRVGLRPNRPAIRVSAQQLTPDTTLLHNYGHGGAGVSLSWGCAHEIGDLVLLSLSFKH